MSFRTNSYQQLSLTDSFSGLTFREQKALEHSWAKSFAEDIFPFINEEPFEVLYSSNASRPNTPVNVCIGALIIKEVFGISDDEIVENLMLDPRYQYALHTTSCEEQPLSDKTLSRFRKRCYDYESAYGIDLLHNCITSLSEKIAKMMDLNPRIKRMDSMMIAANIRKLSRTELLYTCVAKLAVYFHKNNPDVLPEDFGHYCDPNDYNRTFYYNNDSETDNRLKNILKDADKLLSICGSDYDDVTEYQLLVRCLSEQTVVKEAVRRLRTKEDGGLHSGILQNPSDPDATFREKAGKEALCGSDLRSCGIVSALHEVRRLCIWAGRYSAAVLRVYVFSAYYGSGSFYAERKRDEIILPAVSGLRNFFICRDAAV